MFVFLNSSLWDIPVVAKRLVLKWSETPRYSDDDAWPRGIIIRFCSADVKPVIPEGVQLKSWGYPESHHPWDFFPNKKIQKSHPAIGEPPWLWLCPKICWILAVDFELPDAPRKFAAWWMWPCPIPQCKTCPRPMIEVEYSNEWKLKN